MELTWSLKIILGLVVFLLFQVLHETFPQHTFLMNGLVQGVKVTHVSPVSNTQKSTWNQKPWSQV